MLCRLVLSYRSRCPPQRPYGRSTPRRFRLPMTARSPRPFHVRRSCLHISLLVVSLGFSVPFSNAALFWRFVIRSGDCSCAVGTRSGCPLCPPVAPGGGFTLSHFRTAAHAARPPPAPPQGGCLKSISRGHFPFIFARFRRACISTHSLRFLYVFSPLLSLLGCRSLCHGSSRFALHF